MPLFREIKDKELRDEKSRNSQEFNKKFSESRKKFRQKNRPSVYNSLDDSKESMFGFTDSREFDM